MADCVNTEAINEATWNARERRVTELENIERRARKVVAAYLAMDTPAGSISELHPVIDDLRIALGMSSVSNDR